VESLTPNETRATPGTIDAGWREYAETVVSRTENDGVRLLIQLGYYGGAAQALGMLTPENTADWPEIVAALALEVCDATDRLLLATLLGRPRP